MKVAYDEDGLRILEADVMVGLRSLPDRSVHCVVTSPPYWALRDYRVKGAIGLEATPALYLRRLVKVFREVRRVLRDDGTLWVNMGDKMWGGGMGGGGSFAKERKGWNARPRKDVSGGHSMKAKDLMGMPWRLAFALQADGWYLRRDIIWEKPNCMPESARDRPTTAHEYIFLLTKKPRYFYDGFAVRECPRSGPSDLRKMAEGLDRIGGYTLTHADTRDKANASTNIGKKRAVGDPFGRNSRSVWSIATAPSSLKHFAMFPEQLAGKCIRAGTSDHGCCAHCGAPWKRVTEPTPAYTATLGKGYHDHEDDLGAGMGQPKAEWFRSVSSEYVHAGWAPGCKHEAPVVPCVVLDPFAGMATTLKVARDLGRSAIGIEISAAYNKRAVRRLRYGTRGAVAMESGAQEALL